MKLALVIAAIFLLGFGLLGGRRMLALAGRWLVRVGLGGIALWLCHWWWPELFFVSGNGWTAVVLAVLGLPGFLLLVFFQLVIGYI
ncbi:MAG TPA: hypothetical protein H9687_03720 [Firmicutes bacterium]|nr:hypothetical protein [Bacillota bacterium]